MSPVVDAIIMLEKAYSEGDDVANIILFKTMSTCSIPKKKKVDDSIFTAN